MHSKYIIRDDDTVWTGSGNWTYGAGLAGQQLSCARLTGAG